MIKLGFILPLLSCVLFFTGSFAAAQDRPNIPVIIADDVGFWNVSRNNRGMMGYRTPNIDRIASEGLSFTDYYGEQSCSAGRAALITGQIPVRTGLTKGRYAGSGPRTAARGSDDC
jgi:arylsulfatase A-like enzyme